MKQLSLILFLLVIINSCSQTSSKSFYFPEVGWTIGVPNNIEIQSIAQFDTIVSNLETQYNFKLDSGEIRALCLLKSGKIAQLRATIAMADSMEFKTFEECFRYNMMSLFSIIKGKMTLVDSSTSQVKLNGVEFMKLKLLTSNLKYPNVQTTTVSYSTWRNGYEFEIAITYIDPEKGKELINIVENSKFGN